MFSHGNTIRCKSGIESESESIRRDSYVLRVYTNTFFSYMKYLKHILFLLILLIHANDSLFYFCFEMRWIERNSERERVVRVELVVIEIEIDTNKTIYILLDVNKSIVFFN